MRATGGNAPIRKVLRCVPSESMLVKSEFVHFREQITRETGTPPCPAFHLEKRTPIPGSLSTLSIISSLACGGGWWRPEVRLILSFEVSAQVSFMQATCFPFFIFKKSSPYSSSPSHGPASKGWALDIQGSSYFRDQEENMRKVCLDPWILIYCFPVR